MALEKIIRVDQVSVDPLDGRLHIREATIIMEDGKQLSKSYKRKVLDTDADMTNEPQAVIDISSAVWTPVVKTARADARAAADAARAALDETPAPV